MRVRHGLIFGLGALLAAMPAIAQNAPSTARSGPGDKAAKTAAKKTTGKAAPGKAPTKLAQANTGTGTGARMTGDVGRVHSLTEALSASYANNPALQAGRAKLRATDESVPQALSGWRPQVSMNTSAGYGDGYSRQWFSGGSTTTTSGVLAPLAGTNRDSRTLRDIATAQAVITQPVYTGGRTKATTNQAENKVMAERARLIAQEQTAFTDTITAYVGLIQTQQILALRVNNEQVLTRQLQATNDRFRVGEITRTDVAQAEASLAGATADRETAVGNLQTARAAFQRAVGFLPPPDLIEPQPLKLPIRNQTEVASLARANNPTVVAALFDDASAKDAVDVAFSALMPQVSVQGQVFQQANAASAHNSTNGYQVIANLTVPLYQGGAEYSAVRQARQSQQQSQRLVEDAKRNAQQAAVQAWETLTAARATADSTKVQIRANQIALEGVQREAIVGSRTTLDVLNAQQTLLNSQVTLVSNLANLVTASYAVAAAIGRLTARDLALPVPMYDETAYYNAVRDKWVGTGDQAVDQPSR